MKKKMVNIYSTWLPKLFCKYIIFDSNKFSCPSNA